MNFKLKNLLIFIVGLMWTIRCYSQIDKFEFDFPHTQSVDAITIDDKGYIWWVKGSQGIYKFYKYTGKDIITREFKQEDGGLFLGEIIFINDKILVGHKQELFLYNPETNEKMEFLKLPENCEFDWSFKDDRGQIFIFASNKKEDTFPVFRISNHSELQFYFNRTILPDNQYNAMTYGINDLNGALFLSGLYNDLHVYDTIGNDSSLPITNKGVFAQEKECSPFRIDNKNNIWRVQNSNLEIYNPIKQAFEFHPISKKLKFKSACQRNVEGFWLNLIYVDKKEIIWLGGKNSSFYRYDPKTDEIIFLGKKLVDYLGGHAGDIIALFEDRTGNLWGRKRGGIFKIKEKQQLFTRYAVDTQRDNHPMYKNEQHINEIIDRLGKFGKFNSDITTFFEDNRGNLYFNDSRFVFKVGAESKQLEILPIVTEEEKVRLFMLEDLNILSTWDNYLVLEKNNKLIKQPYQFKRLEKVVQSNDTTIWFFGRLDDDLNVLFAKVDKRTLKYNGKYHDAKEMTIDDKEIIFSSVVDSQGNIFVGTNKRIIKINAENCLIEQVTVPTSYLDEAVEISSFHEIHLQLISDDLLGFGTGKEVGIINLKENAFEFIAKVEEIAGDKFFNAIHFKDEQLWFGYEGKLCVYDLNDKRTIHIPYNIDSKKNNIIRDFHPISEGRMAMNTLNGLYIFHPDELLKAHLKIHEVDKHTPIELVKYSYWKGSIDSLNEKLFLDPLAHPIQFDYNDRLVNFTFSLMDFDQPEEHMYSYYLKDFDYGWSKPSHSNQVEYSSLPPGEYTLQVKAHSGDGIWSEKSLNIPIVINPAWYQSWWFYLLCGLTILMVSILIFRYYFKREKRKLAQAEEIKEAKRLKQLDKLKSQFYTNITHEFRTPLTVILGMADNIEGHPNEKDLIKRNSKNLLRLVNQLLEISKAKAQGFSINNINADIVSYLNYLTQSFYSMAKDKGVNLSFHSEEEEVIMDYDEAAIQHIVYNLLSNAIKFTPAGGDISVLVAKKSSEGNEALVVKIKDTGIGIPEENIPMLFDRFYQVKTSSSKREEGSGVGLTLASELAQLLGGKIDVTSKIQENDKHYGTEFAITLPISSSIISKAGNPVQEKKIIINDASADKERTDHYENSSTLDLPTILIIEDNQDIIFYIESILKDSYHILSSENGKGGIDQAIESIPDLIISDVMMPIMNGYEVCEKLKDDDRTSHIPIILLTAKSAQEDKVEGLAIGADAFISKPFDKDELLIRIDKLVALRKHLQRKYGQFSKHNLVENKSKPLSREEQFLQKLKDVIDDSYMDSQFAVPDLAEKVGMSQMQIYRKLKALTGQTPSTYIRKKRLEEAIKLLTQSDQNISEIAYKIGFTDPNYFSKVFNQEFGKPPSDFRDESKLN